MKRLYKIGTGIFIQSISTIVVWFLLSVITGDKNISNVFSIIYPLQFIQLLLRDYFATGGNIRKEKENNPDVVYTSMFLGIISCIICFVLPIIFLDEYIIFFGLNPSDYRLFVLYGFVFLFLQNLVMILVEKLYFEDKENLALIRNVTFNVMNIVLVSILMLITKNSILSIAVTLGILAVYVIEILVKSFKKFKFNFSPYLNLKYTSGNLSAGILMFLIYFFGLRTTFNAGPEFMIAFNLVAQCTDAQHDANKAVATVAKVDIAKDRLDYIKSLKNSFFYILSLVASSIILFFSLFWFYGVSLGIGLIYLSFEIIMMLLFAYLQVIRPYCQLVISSLATAIIYTVGYLTQFVLSVILQTPFCIGFAQTGCFILQLIAVYILRFKYCKRDGNKLVLKKVINSKKDN